MGSIFKGIRMRIAKGTRRPRLSSRTGTAMLISDWTWAPIAVTVVLTAPFVLLAVSIYRLATGRIDTD